MKKIEMFETTDGEQFTTEEAAQAHELKLAETRTIFEKYETSHKELLEVLNKAKIMLDTKPELLKLKEQLSINGYHFSDMILVMNDYNENKDDNLNYQSSYYSSNC